MRPAATLLLALVSLVVFLVDRSDALDAIPAEIHVHSNFSTGEFSLDALADMADKAGVEALLLSENYLWRVEYGLPPFRALTRVVHEEPSVVRFGLDRYLAGVAATRRRFPKLVIVPGVEVIPHYHWTGSPFDSQMTLHNTQKNLLVFGVSDLAALGRLPVIGNSRAEGFTVQSLVDVVPALLLIPGLRALLAKQQRRIRVGRAFVIVRRRRWFLGGLLCLVGGIALVRAWPFGADRYPYWQDSRLLPHQDLIDHAQRLGGVTIWSFPEARDSGQRFVGPVRVAWSTEPYPDDLLRTFHYTAFGALYEDTTHFERAGRGWDILLGQYIKGERSRPVWAVAESGFHRFEAGKTLGTVQTVLLTTDRSEAGVLDAIKQGRMYARLRSPKAGLALAEFAVAGPGGTASIGETLRVSDGAPVEVRIGVDAVTGENQPLRVSLIRNGAVVGGWTAPTPFRIVHRETFDGRPLYFRVDASGTSTANRLLTNPVFVKRP